LCFVNNGLALLPCFTGPTGGKVTPASLQIQDEVGLAVASDCRGERPVSPRVAGRLLKTLQIPTTLPTSDELLGIDGMNEQLLADYYLRRLRGDCINLLGLHAEIEGLNYSGWLRTFLAASLHRGAKFSLLSSIALQEQSMAAPAEIIYRKIPGRAGNVACQKKGS